MKTFLQSTKKEKNPKKKDFLPRTKSQKKISTLQVARMFLILQHDKVMVLWFLKNDTDGLMIFWDQEDQEIQLYKDTDFIEAENNNSLLQFPKYFMHRLNNTFGMQCKIDTICNILFKENHTPKIPQAI